MRSPSEPPGWPSYYMLRQIHQGRRYRVLAIVATITFLFICGWSLMEANLNTVSGLGLKHYYNSIFSAETNTPLTSGQSLIPAKIWQIYLPKRERHGDHWHEQTFISPQVLQGAPSWLALNADYQYTLVSGEGGSAFVQRHYSHRPELVEAYNNLTNVGMKSDFLRYLILGVEGGVYSDTDTLLYRPVSEWIPQALRTQVRLIVGIEFDRLDGPSWADIPHELQFCQWTIAAAPDHPVFTKMTDRVLDSMRQLSEARGGSLSDAEIGSFDVMNSTGPAAWTDVVFSQLQEYEPLLTTPRDLSGLTEPVLFGDVLVLPIDGFGMGQLHSNSTNDGTIPRTAYVQHLFTGSWRSGEDEEGG